MRRAPRLTSAGHVVRVDRVARARDTASPRRIARVLLRSHGHVGEDLGIVRIARRAMRRCDMAPSTSPMPAQHDARARSATASRSGRRRQRQLVLAPWPVESSSWPIAGRSRCCLTDRALRVGFHGVAPQRLRVPPDLYLIPGEGREGDDPGRRHGSDRAPRARAAARRRRGAARCVAQRRARRAAPSPRQDR